MKTYNFNFEPSHIFRVYWKADTNEVIIKFLQSTLIRQLDKGERENYFTQLKEYCLKSKIGIEVQDYEEN